MKPAIVLWSSNYAFLSLSLSPSSHSLSIAIPIKNNTETLLMSTTQNFPCQFYYAEKFSPHCHRCIARERRSPTCPPHSRHRI